MIWDSHMHTNFSGDSDALPESMIEQAIHLGLPGICITDHLDYDYPDDPDLFLIDLPKYSKKISELKEQYQDRIPIHFGIELGLQPHLSEKLQTITASMPFDFVIGSSHVVHGIDPYYPHYYEGRTEKEAYEEYFSSILENLEAFSDFDAYGHIDYVVRYGPDKNKNYNYAAYAEVLDEILKMLIRMDKALEVNTAGFKYGLGHPNPCEEIISRYHELGGRLLTIGADGHAPEQMAWDFDKIPALLKSCGFDNYTVYKKRKPVFLPL